MLEAEALRTISHNNIGEVVGLPLLSTERVPAVPITSFSWNISFISVSHSHVVLSIILNTHYIYFSQKQPPPKMTSRLAIVVCAGYIFWQLFLLLSLLYIVYCTVFTLYTICYIVYSI